MSRETRPADASALRVLITGYETAQVIFVAARLGVADLLAEGPRATEELAAALRADAGALRRLLQALELLGGQADASRGQAPGHAFQVCSEQLDV